MRKPALVIVLMISTLLMTTACSSSANKAQASPTVQSTTVETTTPTELELTLDELSKYNGKDGQPAYVAVDGIIYDVSSSPKWKNGTHNGFQAGNDLTDKIKKVSPHGVKVLERLKKVGTLKTSQ